MNENVLGIDLGTSSVKILQRFRDGRTEKAKAVYPQISLCGWWEALCQALSQLDLSRTVAIGLSSQVGTYIVNDRDVISWNDPVGAEEVAQIKEAYPAELFLREISMEHPQIASYPIPRLKYIKEHYGKIATVCQPKDFLCERLTGNRVTDPYSWRGLANLETGAYSKFFLDALEICPKVLPKMIGYAEIAGYTQEKETALPAGIPVYVGLNDYYAALVGMGVEKEGDLFDISGTSEHLGVLQEECAKGTPMVSGPYLWQNVHYGVTASSGAANDFALQLGDGVFDMEDVKHQKPPIFLPYLKGERAPVWDADARGVFFGIEAGCKRELLSYAVFEGVIFSLYHIYETMGKPPVTAMTVAGGAAVNDCLNMLKAEMFGVPIKTLEEQDTSALGAALVAAVGAGWYADLTAAMQDAVRIKKTVTPTLAYNAWLKKRYWIYKELYPAVKSQYKTLKELEL